ncbi:unnamed protein product [Euphydryas editha]|uniref:SV2A/B/C luminal domain-containing protein n=1 Tax=Euphydryas editha TaxID=104508 RepID=A0AAU9TBS1_EUPED|nr:unnamed protein product [Euphydryas editha]
MAAGVLLSAGLARAVLPPTGERALADHRDHFSAWHRYLLLCTIPILASLISLIWTPESPRYLLEAGREVDAMMVYQSVHRGNQSRACGACGAAEWRLSELALPAKRRAPALHHVWHSFKMFWQAFFQIFSSTYRNTTIALTGMLLFTVAIQFYLSSYIPATVNKFETELYDLSKQTVQNVTYEDVHYNETLENIDFIDVSFKNCTFRDLLMSHVEFINCSFVNTALSNIRTSYTAFRGVIFVNSTVIDTDMELGRELDAECVLNASIVRGMRGECSRRADLRWSQNGRLAERTYAAHAALLAAPLLAPRALHRPHVHVAVCAACLLLSPSLYIARSETALYIVEAVYAFLIMIIYFGVAVKILDTYPANLRCTAHGLMLSVAYMAGAAIRGLMDLDAIYSCLLCAYFALMATISATRLL